MPSVCRVGSYIVTLLRTRSGVTSLNPFRTTVLVASTYFSNRDGSTWRSLASSRVAAHDSTNGFHPISTRARRKKRRDTDLKDGVKNSKNLTRRHDPTLYTRLLENIEEQRVVKWDPPNYEDAVISDPYISSSYVCMRSVLPLNVLWKYWGTYLIVGGQCVCVCFQ